MSKGYWLAGAISLAMLAVAPAASAQTTAPAEGEDCLAIGSLWSGSLDDVAHIAGTPVPESYRRMFFAKGCRSLLPETLIDWHLAFGDEASATAALAFLETNTAKAPYAADLARPIARSRDAAQLRTLTETARGDIFLAEQYLRAAEFHRSPVLLAKAAHYLAPVPAAVTAAKAFATSTDSALQAAASIENFDGTAEGLEIRLAVVRAQITRSDKDLAAAETVLSAKENPLYRTAAERAFEAGDDFCDVGDSVKAFAEACREDEFERKAILWLRYRATLDILATDLSNDSAKADTLSNESLLPDVLRIVHRSEAAHTGSGRKRYSPAEDAEVELRLATVDAQVHLAGLMPADRWTAGRTLQAALTELMEAEGLVPPTASPARFRQIGIRFLAVYDQAVAIEAKEKPGATTLGYAVMDREAAYFRTMLPLLKSIAAGR